MTATLPDARSMEVRLRELVGSRPPREAALDAVEAQRRRQIAHEHFKLLPEETRVFLVKLCGGMIEVVPEATRKILFRYLNDGLWADLARNLYGLNKLHPDVGFMSVAREIDTVTANGIGYN